jgi:hypothetical protein
MREVCPEGHDTTVLDRILADTGLRNKATVLTIDCPKRHVLARVLQANRELVYVARHRHGSMGLVELGAKDGHFTSTVKPPPPKRTHMAEEYVEFLDAAERGWAGFDPTFRAECECTQATWTRTWLRSKLASGHRRVTAPRANA